MASEKRKCSGKNSRGKPCRAWAIKGGTVCVAHGGNAPQVKAKAAIRAEVMNWGLGDSTTDPGDTLLRLVSQSAQRAARYAAELEALVAESPNLREALIAEVWISNEHDRYKAGEYVRGLAKLEAEERDRCANFSTKAIAAGIAERQVRLAEQQGELVAQVIKAVLGDLGLTKEQQAEAPAIVRRHLLALAG